MNSNNKKITPYLLIGSATALGGIALGITGSWIYNKFRKNKNDVKCTIPLHTQNEQANRTDGVYIEENGTTQFLTDEEFQRYFEFNINKEGIELDWCLLEYALKLDPMNLRFFNDEQKTLSFEKLAVKQNIKSIVYCRSKEEIYNIESSDTVNNKITYTKYEIHDYAFDLYGNDIYNYIDNPEGYSYEELMEMPPPEFKDMTMSEVFHILQNEEQNKEHDELNNPIKNIIQEHIPSVVNIEFTGDSTSSEEENK